MEHHVSSSDPWTIPETTARDSWYGGGSSIPDVWCDGKYEVLGASNCNSAYSSYLSRYNTRMSETGGISPVSVEGTFQVSETGGSFSVTYTLLDPATLGSIRATMFVYEEGLQYGGVTYNEVTRVIKDVSVTGLVNPGDHVTLDVPFNVGSSWVLDNLHAVAILQKTTTPKEIIQAARLELISDFKVIMPECVTSVPEGSGTALVHATVKNTSLAPDLLHLSVDQSAGWPTDMQIAGDTGWYTSTDVTLDPSETVDMIVRVQTDAEVRIGEGNFIVQSNASGRTQNCDFRVFNGSYAILLVDDDYNGGFEDVFIHALDGLGYLYEDWDVYYGHGNVSPKYTDMAGFDVVIWQNGYRLNDLLSAGDRAELAQYLDAGGNLYVNSMDLTSTVSQGDPFMTDYLGAASWTNNTRSHTEYGVEGDPISSGLVLPLYFSGGETTNRVDTVNPTDEATAFFFSELGDPNAVRLVLPNQSRTVFSTVLQNAISESDPAPNNNQTVMQRIIMWLAGDPTSVDQPLLAQDGAVLRAQPNPFSPSTSLSFSLSSSQSVRLTVVDAAGRIVRNLLDAPLAAGRHQANWDGLDDHGRAAPSGIYFVRLLSEQGEASGKLVLAR